MIERITRWLLKCVSMILVFISAVIPFLLLGTAIALEYKGQFIFAYNKCVFFWVLLIIGILTIAFRYLNIYYNENPDNLKSLKAEIRFSLSDGKNAWIFGFGIALIIVAVYLLFSSKNNLYSRYDTIFTIYITILAITLAARVLYKNTAPIIGANELLREMTNDLIRNRHKNPRVWIVYIAPNIGFYRNYLRNPEIFTNKTVKNDSVKNTYTDFFFTLKDVIDRQPREVGLFSYNEDEYRNIYEEYDRVIEESEKNHINEVERKNAAINSAKEIFDLFKNAPRRRAEDINVWEVPKSCPFPAPVFIINDTVYYNSSYGLPTYLIKRNGGPNGKFHMIRGERGYAELITWKYQDAVLASAIIAHLKKMKEEYENE